MRRKALKSLQRGLGRLGLRGRALTALMLAVLPLLLTIGAVPKSLVSDVIGGPEAESCCVLGSCCCAMLAATCYCETGDTDEAIVGEDEGGSRLNFASLRCSQTVEMLLAVGLAGVPLESSTSVDLIAPEARVVSAVVPSWTPIMFEIPTPPPRTC